MSNLLEHLDHILEDEELPLNIKTMLNSIDVSEDARASAESYVKDRLADLSSVSQTFQQVVLSIGYDAEAIQQAVEEYTNHVTLLWICIQGDWIQANNIANAHMLIHGEPDQVAVAKAYVCSAFLNPLAKFIDDDVMDQNLKFLANLLNRAKFEDL